MSEELLSLLNRVDAAVDAHAALERVGINPSSFRFSGFGWTVTVIVKLKGSRKKATPIHADGDTPDEAVDKLVNGLDIWAKALA
jgi:hypothetical protein